ncbi:MAG: amino acid adenylation domain-containing protein [Planctomycetota bacterium]
MPEFVPSFLHELFEQSALRRATQIAVELPAVDGEAAPVLCTYGAVLARASALRARLQSRVLGECIVAIVLPKDSPCMHAAQIAVMQAGAAFLCLDLSFPDEHVRFVLADAEVAAVIVDADSAERLAGFGIKREALINIASVGAEDCGRGDEPTEAMRSAPPWLGPESLAYVIYTSGTTGRPKGVMISHRSVLHLLSAEQDDLQLQASDRCVQVSSNAYDSSIEECWLPFAAGATVVVANDDVTRLGPDLVPWLRRHRISVLMPTPTMLRGTGCDEPANELPDLRLVYTGGEAITSDLVDRWARGIHLENGYGPTECTVTVTRARLQPGEPITIGRAIGAARAHVLDAQLQVLDVGKEGELCFSGPCLARGYLRRPELTAARFPDHPEFGRIYRTGDLVRQDQRGDLHFLGRLDSQVKVRGYRIELAAIEAELGMLPDIREALCKVQGDAGREMIVAHCIATTGASIDGGKIAAALRARLPQYMVPARFARLERLPTLVSGKVDRMALPDVAVAEESPDGDEIAPRTPLEHRVAQHFAETLGLSSASVEVDFFEVGGNSLRAAELITRLRREPGVAELAVRDVYDLRTVARLCERAANRASVAEAPLQSERPARGRPLLVTFLQGVWLAIMLAALSAIACAAVYLLLPWLMHQLGMWPVLLLLPIAAALGLPVYTLFAVLIAVAAKRLLIGRYRSMRAPVWGSLYLRNWIVQRCAQVIPWNALRGTEFFNVALRMLGARVGKRVHIHRGVELVSGGWDLLSIGNDVTLSQDAIVGLVEYDDGDIVFGAITLGDGSTLDIRAGMQGGSSLGRHSYVAALSNVAPGTHVPEQEKWDGVPAIRVAAADPVPAPNHQASARMSPVGYGLLLIVMRSVLGWAMAAPAVAVAIALLWWFDVSADAALEWLWRPTSSILVFALVAACAALAVISRLVVSALLLRVTKPVAAGVYVSQSRDHLRIWLRTGLLEAAGRWLSGSLYWRWWLRAAGMRLGRNCEISTIIDCLPEQVAIGAGTFFADGVYLAGPRMRGGGAVTVAATTLGRDSFVGNHAVLHAGTELPPSILIGVSTVADPSQLRAGSSWFGHPPIELPQREVVDLDRKLTHDPSVFLYVQRLLWETLRFALPAVTTAVMMLWLAGTTLLVQAEWQTLLLLLPMLSLAAGGVLAMLVLVTKWLLLGRVKPGTHGLWSAWCCRWDFLYMAWGMLAHGPLAPFAGTLWLPMYLRAMGMRIGKRVVLAGSFAQVVDPDMLTVEDGATVDPMFQAHTFEDRVLKIGPVRIRKNATVGRAAVLFYGTNIGARTSVAPHSVVMKNETLSDGRKYVGVPAGLQP